jgi:hypothetical protein
MKCVRCGHDSKYKEREGGTCPKCKGEFAFEPKNGDRYTDGAFQHAIDVVSSQGTVRFDLSHLHHHLSRMRPPTQVLAIVLPLAVAIVGTLFAVVVAHDASLFMGIVGVAIAMAAAFGVRWLTYDRSPTLSLERASFDAYWTRWVRVHGAPKGLIQKARRALPARSRELEAELRSYSFDRAVICDKPAVVDVLVANRFHFENNCAILSVGGYPEAAFDTVRAMLRNNPRLLVLALHDATPEGCQLAHRLANDPDWFQGRARVIDVGLRPAQAKAKGFQGMWQRSTRAVQARDGIIPEEAVWLSQFTLELAAIRPEQLIKRLYKAMVTAEALPTSGGDSGGDGWLILASDSGTTDGGGDSFG